MKVLQALPFQFFGGPENQSVQIAIEAHRRQLVKTNFVFFVGEHLKEPDLSYTQEHLKKCGLESFVLRSPRIREFRNSREKLRSLIGETKADVLVSSGYVCDGLSAYQGVPHMVYFHGFTKMNRIVRVYEWLDSWIMRSADHIAVVSDEQNQQLVSKGRSVSLVKNAFSVSGEQSILSKEQVASELGIELKAKDFVIVTLARLSKEKGVLDIPSIAELTMNQIPNLKWVLIGDGPLRIELEQEIHRRNLQNTVLLAGHQTRAMRFLGVADLVAMPSHREGLPVALLEAMAIGRAVVGTDVGGLGETLRASKAGYLAPRLNNQEFSQQIVRAYHDSSRHEKVKVGRHHIERHFSVDQQVRCWLAALETTRTNFKSR